MSESRRNSFDSMETHSRYTHSESTRADNYSDSFESEPESGQIRERKQTPPRKVKKTTMHWRKKQSTQRNTKLMKIAPTYEMEQKIVAAKKLSNNELRNLNVDLLRQVEMQKDEIRLLKRMEYRQGKALEKFENSNNRLPMLLESHNKEMLSLREQVRTMKVRYRKSQESLREVEDELEKTKNRLNKYKVLVDDENLQERAELTKQLNIAQQKVHETEAKIRDLETYVQHLVKNHRHEINIEKMQSKKIRFNIQELEEKYNRLEIQLLEKEKELEVWNIYSNRQRNVNQKLSSSHFHTPRSTPSVKSKSNERIPPLTPPPLRMKKYEERRRQTKKQKESMLKKINPPSPKVASDTKISQPPIIDNTDYNPPMQALNQPQKAIDNPPPPAMDTHKFTCQESIQEEIDLGEMLENVKLEEKILPEPKMEPEETAIKPEEKELKKLDIERIEEDVKKETKELLQKAEEDERKKKDLLLARLKELDNKYQTLVNPRNDPFPDSPFRTDYNFTKQTENLHQGKPSNDLDFLDSPLRFSHGKPNSLLNPNQSNVATPSKKGNRLSSRKSDNMIEDFFPSTVSPKNPDGLKMSGFVNGDAPIHHGSSENRTRRSNKMESSVYKELFGENVDDNSISTKNKDNDLILGDLSRRPSKQDWINQTVGGLFSGDGLNNGHNEGSKLLPSRQQISLFETRSTLNAFDNSSDSIEEIIL